MARTAVCDRTPAEETYKGFRVIEQEGYLYAVPTHLVKVSPRDRGRYLNHPAVVGAPTREALEALLDVYDPAPFLVEPLGELDGYELTRYRGRVYGVPRALGPVDLNLEEDRTRDGVVSGETCDEVRERIRADRSAAPVEFAGWLPVFQRFGNCGAHPQFAHTQSPPPGYKFVRSCPRPADRPPSPWRWLSPLTWAAWLVRGLAACARPFVAVARNAVELGPWRCLRALAALVRLFFLLLRRGGKVGPTLRFLHSRHFRSQVLVPPGDDLLFLTSVPYTYGQRPWVIEVEDSTTLFFPFVHNGRTSTLDIARSPYFPLVKALLESDRCRGIITHMRSTAQTLPTLFQSERIARKTTYVPLGVKVPRRWQPAADDAGLNVLFTNSWHQVAQGFFLRGGLDVLEAFAVLHERYPQLRLTLRSAIPTMAPRYYRILERCGVRVLDRFLHDEELDGLLGRSHIYLLPAARVHIVSVLRAMAHGLAVVVSDGWGMHEYVAHGRNGLIVPGRAGKVSWMDERVGLLRENYRPMYAPSPVVVAGLVEAVSRLVEDRELRRGLGRRARSDVETTYNLEQWNRGLQAAFDKARAG
jgi:glycosyltransferase involved in cell wall biosynthesis